MKDLIESECLGSRIGFTSDSDSVGLLSESTLVMLGCLICRFDSSNMDDGDNTRGNPKSMPAVEVVCEGVCVWEGVVKLHFGLSTSVHASGKCWS